MAKTATKTFTGYAPAGKTNKELILYHASLFFVENSVLVCVHRRKGHKYFDARKVRVTVTVEDIKPDKERNHD